MWPRRPKKALADHLTRTGRVGTVTDGTSRIVPQHPIPRTPTTWKIDSDWKDRILDPQRDQLHRRPGHLCLLCSSMRSGHDGLKVVRSMAGKGLQLLGHQQLSPESGGQRGLPAAAEQRRGGAQRRLAHRAAAPMCPPRRARPSAVRCSTTPGRDAPARGRGHGAGRLRGPQPQVQAGGRQRLSVPRRHGAGLLRRDRCLPAGKKPVSGTKSAGWTKSSPWRSTMWTSACGCGMRVTALPGRPTPG